MMWDGLGAIVIDNPSQRHFFGKVTMYTDFNVQARDYILSFMNFYFPDKEKQNFNKIEKGHENPKTWALYKIALVPDVPFSKFFEWE